MLPKDPDALLNADEFCAFLKCEEGTFRSMRDDGRLPPPTLYVGKQPRWRAGAIRAWVRSGVAAQPPAAGPKPGKTPQKGTKGEESPGGLED